MLTAKFHILKQFLSQSFLLFVNFLILSYPANIYYISFSVLTTHCPCFIHLGF